MDKLAPILLNPSRTGSPDPKGSVFFVGTATVIIKLAGFTVLTDPNFLHRGERIHLGYGMHDRRLTDPAISFDELPPLDLVVLSHMHEDHFDRLVEQRLDRSVPIATTGHASAILRRKGFSEVRALQTWRSLELFRGHARLRITAMPGLHGPGLLGALLMPPVMGSLLEFITGQSRYRIYISGDTLVHQQLREIPRRFPDIDLAILHLGGTRVLGVLLTMDGEQGLEAMKIASARVNIPIHYDDYGVFKSPLSEFQREVDRAGLADRVHYMGRGDTWTIDRELPLPAESRPSLP